ncbi:PREDICTED: uncharacterized protein LOC106128415 [Papilio xuthus]|uniref:Uncharacterized protein LOC106128415 n=1 Tax=Papilio xuthus TaxID=66420 RepID=A0AAJ7ELH5_PAPXU|nr:PREDICTED: uncharacterized protein LOC106128415 [Papilio xuthus]
MEIDESPRTNIKCFKSHVKCLGPLNIDYNASSTTFILWNKYEMYVYENLKFECASNIIMPEFHIFHLISSNNFIVCLDFEGNIHLTSMKFKQSAPKRLKTIFLHKEKCILSCTLYTSQKLISLKLECNTYYLCINNLNSEFDLEKKIKLTLPNENSQPLQEELKSYILKSYKLYKQYDNLNRVFNIDGDVSKDYNLIIISFDRRVLYGCVISLKMQVNEIALQNLLSAPTSISDVKVIEDLEYILISLESGTFIRLLLADLNKNDIVHLNKNISKCVPYNECIIYTDGITMWKSNNTFKQDINFQQFHINQIKDFICFGDQILCTTFTNLIYLFTIDNEIFIKSSSEYCDAKKILNDDTGCVYKILEEIERNYKLEEKIKEECNYITSLSLSNRPDILDSVITYSIILYNTYEDILKESIDLTLTEKVESYFSNNIFCLLIKIKVTFEKHKINALLEVLRDLQIHMTLLSSNKVIKTTSVRVVEELKNINLLIPLNGKNVTLVTTNIKILKRIPGMQKNEELLIIMHEKEIILNAEHFIKSYIMKQNITRLKEIENSIEEIINEIAYKSSKHLFKFTIDKTQSNEFSFYMKLPNNYIDAFKNESYLKNIFSTEKALKILKENTSEDFLNGRNNKIFEIGNSKVKVNIINDEFTNNSLKVTCDDMKIGFDVRNFYCNLAYDNFTKHEPGREFVRHTLYTTIENIQKGVRRCISDGTEDNLKSLLEQLQSYVYAAMPL